MLYHRNIPISLVQKCVTTRDRLRFWYPYIILLLLQIKLRYIHVYSFSILYDASYSIWIG